ncbi:alpha/beta fold hydrolase [Bacillus sp. FJAT-45066]|uniref:alpha/beta fold hydrolase n=1 Tax=Bacillus sp. FJAT-45066 TaxID=2011010 RepID=UPI000BB84757|nr:alpha/beta fold hydrolase [Bacillus sp. FJAT-45066]
MSNFNNEKPFFRLQHVTMDGPTKREALWKKNKATLWYYKSPKKQYKEPLFLIYSLVNQPFILDLLPGASMIESFVNNGYDVYLLDFGIPGYEDKDITVDEYIVDYIQNAVRRCLRHASAKEVSIIGYCLGGTFAAVYAAIADEPIRNLILDVTPIDFSELNQYDQLMKDFRNGDLQVDEIIDAYGIIPALFMKAGVRMITSPVYYSRYLALLNKHEDEKYVQKWHRFNDWAEGHIPFAGAALKQLINDFVRENKLVKGKIKIKGSPVHLENITANLLVISAKDDKLVPQSQTYPIMNLVSSKDKTYKLVSGGHTSMSFKDGGLPEPLDEWLPKRSTRLK